MISSMGFATVVKAMMAVNMVSGLVIPQGIPDVINQFDARSGEPCVNTNATRSYRIIDIQAEEKLARINYAKGAVIVDAESNKAPLTAGMLMHPGDVIHTDVSGFVSVVLGDGSVVSIQPESDVVMQNSMSGSAIAACESSAEFKIGLPYVSAAVRG